MAAPINFSFHVVEEREIVKVQDALIDAFINSDVETMARILADDFSFIDDDGVVLNKRQLIDFLRSGEDRVISYRRQDDRVRFYNNVAILSYCCRIDETVKGRDVSGDFRVTRIFVKRRGRWQIVGGQDTPI